MLLVEFGGRSYIQSDAEIKKITKARGLWLAVKEQPWQLSGRCGSQRCWKVSWAVLPGQGYPLGYEMLFSPSVVSSSLWPHGLQHARLPCPSLSPGDCSNSCPLSWWCHHPTISSSVIPFSSHLQSSPASGSFQMSLLFASGGQSSGASALAEAVLISLSDMPSLLSACAHN